jgi:16S rRNA (guanine966-N2)-methyltransferase
MPRGVRPTQAVVREAIFDLLGDAVVGAHVLDLFAGSGALGIEALSRGAARVTFVERVPAVIDVLRRTLTTLRVGERARVVRAEVTRWLEANPSEVATASVILLDPPYNDPVLERTVALLDRLAASRTLVVAEHAWRQPWPATERLCLRRQRRYGDTMVTVSVTT